VLAQDAGRPQSSQVQARSDILLASWDPDPTAAAAAATAASSMLQDYYDII